jgi:hypothetical protein
MNVDFNLKNRPMFTLNKVQASREAAWLTQAIDNLSQSEPVGLYLGL